MNVVDAVPVEQVVPHRDERADGSCGIPATGFDIQAVLGIADDRVALGDVDRISDDRPHDGVPITQQVNPVSAVWIGSCADDVPLDQESAGERVPCRVNLSVAIEDPLDSVIGITRDRVVENLHVSHGRVVGGPQDDSLSEKVRIRSVDGIRKEVVLNQRQPRQRGRVDQIDGEVEIAVPRVRVAECGKGTADRQVQRGRLRGCESSPAQGVVGDRVLGQSRDERTGLIVDLDIDPQTGGVAADRVVGEVEGNRRPVGPRIDQPHPIAIEVADDRVIRDDARISQSGQRAVHGDDFNPVSSVRINRIVVNRHRGDARPVRRSDPDSVQAVRGDSGKRLGERLRDVK